MKFRQEKKGKGDGRSRSNPVIVSYDTDADGGNGDYHAAGSPVLLWINQSHFWLDCFWKSGKFAGLLGR